MNPRRAFTLVELLMVITITAIVAALLLSALTGAKKQSAKAADLNNFRQILAAMHIYSSDNKESLPWSNWDYGGAMPDGTARAGWLYQPVSGPPDTNHFNGHAGLLWDALRGGNVLLCPLDQPDEARYSARNDKIESRAQQLSSYIMNGAIAGYRSGYHSNALPVKISQMLPRDCVYWEGDERDPFNFNDGSSWPYEGISLRHANGSVTGTLDGSSVCVKARDWQTDVADTNKNRLWCFPNTADGGDLVYGHDQ